jgi:hypothetical protein
MKDLKLMMLSGVLALSVVAQGTSDEKLQKAITDTRAYIDRIAKSVRPTANNDNFPKPDDVRKAHAAINAAEDEFIASNIDPRHVNQKVAEKIIRAIDYHTEDPKELAEIVKILGRQPDEENGSLTYVFVSPGPSLIVGYGLGGGSMDDSEVTIRAYKPLNGRFALTAEIGSDTDAEWKGVSFYMRELPSPITGETWLLTWGEVLASNGAEAYDLQLFAYDGNKFRTVWNDGAIDLKIALTKFGFTVAHEILVDDDRNGGRSWKSDEYALTPAGPKLIASDTLSPEEFEATQSEPR